MGYSVKSNTSIGIREEVTEGTYLEPLAAEYMQVLKDGESMDVTKELVERNVFNGSLGQTTPRRGLEGVTGALPVELKANGTEGAAPEYGLLWESCLGTKRNAVTKTSSDADGGTYSDTVICLADADANVFNIGDVVTTKRSGAYHTSPISSVSNAAGDTNITLLIADPAGAYVDGIVITAVQTYYPADSGHPSFSVAKYIEDAVRESAWGCKVNSVSLEGFTTGGIASLNFAYEGADGTRAVAALGVTPTYDSALPPIILDACVYKDGVAVGINEATLSIENTLSWITTTCNGKIASRVTDRKITGTIDPYKENDDVAYWTLFDNGTAFSLFLRAYVPTTTTGEYGDVCSIYLPNCTITSMADADADGLLKDVLTFSADRGVTGTTNEIYVSYN